MADRMTRVIEYSLSGAGWAQGTVVLDGRRIALDASYIHDTFTNIVEALLAACGSNEAVEWVYFHEPASTHVHLTLADGRRVITLRRFPDFRVPRSRLGNPSTLIAEEEMTLRQLVADVMIAGSKSMPMESRATYNRGVSRFQPARSRI
jgi:hypothetical protein